MGQSGGRLLSWPQEPWLKAEGPLKPGKPGGRVTRRGVSQEPGLTYRKDSRPGR